MSELNRMMDRGMRDLPVYITDVRNGFLAGNGADLVLDLKQFDGALRRFCLRLPVADITSTQQRDFLRDYLFAEVPRRCAHR